MNSYLNRYFFISCICIMFAGGLHAQTVLRDTLRGIVLTKDRSPYHLVDTVFVLDSLTIEPGVVLLGLNPDNPAHDGAMLLSHHGFISAPGRMNDSIIFDAVNIELKDPSWELSGTSGSYFSFCLFQNARGPRPSLYLGSSNVIENSRFRNNITGLGFVDFVEVTSSVFESNNLGAFGGSFHGNSIISNCIFRWNVTGVSTSWSTVHIQNCEILGNSEYGVLVNHAATDVTVIGGAAEYCNKIYENGINLYVAQYGSQHYGTVYAPYNYWGTTDTVYISKAISTQWEWLTVDYLPYTNENCQPYTVGMEDAQSPATYALSSYPNPAASGTPVTLRYTLERASQLTLVLRDVLGRIVSEQSLGTHAPGEHRHAINTAGLRPGLYFYTLLPTSGTPLSGKMVVR